MKLATFSAADLIAPRVGVVVDEHVHAFPVDLTMRDVIDAGLDAARRLAERARLLEPARPLAEVRLEVPLRPSSVRDFVAFEEHVDGVRRSVDGATGVPEAWYDAPAFYFTNPHTLMAPYDDVRFPAASVARDFELEVAVVVGAPGTSLTVAEAADHVFGYTVMNDWSARDLQSREMQVRLGPAKGKDFATTLGPWIVTADELEPHRDGDGFLDLWCTAEVNGVEVGRDLLGNAGWTFEAMIAHASRDSRVEAGDVLGSGTVGNGGCLAELWGRNGQHHPPPLQSGDVVTLTVEGIGSVSNRVLDSHPAPPAAPVRRRDHAAARQVLR